MAVDLRARAGHALNLRLINVAIFAGLAVWTGVNRTPWLSPGFALMAAGYLAGYVTFLRADPMRRLKEAVAFFGLQLAGTAYLVCLFAGMPNGGRFWVAFGGSVVVLGFAVAFSTRWLLRKAAERQARDPSGETRSIG